jgi:hypothetical protein
MGSQPNFSRVSAWAASVGALHHVDQRLAGYVTGHLRANQRIRSSGEAAHVAADVRGQQQVRRAPEWVPGRERLGLSHIERGVDAAGLELDG